MNRPTAASDEAVLGALEGIVRMQRGIRSSDIDVCIETGLVFLRINYQSLPGNIARRLTETDPRAVEEIPAATDKGGSREKQRALAAKLASDERVPGEDRLRPTRARWLAGRPGR